MNTISFSSKFKRLIQKAVNESKCKHVTDVLHALSKLNAVEVEYRTIFSEADQTQDTYLIFWDEVEDEIKRRLLES